MGRDAPAALTGLAAEGIAIHAGQRELVSELSLHFAPGEFVAILGRNGSGKTLSLHTLAGLRPPQRGTVRLDGQPLAHFKRRTIAQRLGLLMQDLEDGFTSTALEAVLIGRHPHLALWRWESAMDEQIGRRALERVGLEDFASRNVDTLSGGEQRRVAVATLLAQEPGIFLLDEPTNHLDPQHQMHVLGLFRSLADLGSSVVATLHDPTLAARFADRVVLLFGDGRWRSGPIHEVLTDKSLTELYSTPMLEVAAQGRRIFVSA